MIRRYAGIRITAFDKERRLVATVYGIKEK